MAERRMMSKKIIHSDAFLDMPATSQNLYFHLLLEADDEGFVNSPKRIQRTVGATDGDAQMLIAKKFILSFESGVIVIKHWRIHNYIQNDRFKSSNHFEERSKLVIKDNNAYTLDDGYNLDTNCTPSIGEDRLGKVSIVENRDIVSGEPSSSFISIDVIQYLNSKAGTNFKQHIKKTIGLIQARQNEGFNLDDFKTVIDKQCLLWKSDPKMCIYLRPDTLFGNKFEGYLNATISPKNQAVSRHNAETMQIGLNQIGYESVFDAYEEIR